MGSSPIQIAGFVGVMANITDCRSVAMGSIPLRTAWMSGGAMVSISEFDSEDVGRDDKCLDADRSVGIRLQLR